MEIEEYKKALRYVQNNLKEKLNNENKVNNILKELFLELKNTDENDLDNIKMFNNLQILTFIFMLISIYSKAYLSLSIMLATYLIFKKSEKCIYNINIPCNIYEDDKNIFNGSKSPNKYKVEISKIETAMSFLNSLDKDEAKKYLKYKI